MQRRIPVLIVLAALAAPALPQPACAQEARTLGIVADQPKQEKLADLEDLIGDWNIKVETFDADGSVSGTFDGEWNFYYILGGTAVQDVFFLPPRSVSLPDESARFIGTGLRTFNPEANAWEASWVDSGSRATERWAGTSSQGEVVFTREAEGVVHRSSYRVEAGRLYWEQSESRDGGRSWTLTQTAVGERGE